MKTLCIQFNGYQGNWLKTQAGVRGIHPADYVRELIDKHMEEPHFFEYFKTVEEKIVKPKTEQPHLIYTLMIYKLMEQLVLNQKEGRQKCETAHNDTLEWLKRLKVYPQYKGGYRLSVLLSPMQLDWLAAQAKLLKKRPVRIIRKIVFLASNDALEKELPQADKGLTEIQQAKLKTVLMTSLLLKSYIIDAYEGGEKLVKSCEENAEVLHQSLSQTS